MTVEEYNQSVDLYSDAIYRFVLKNIRDKDDAKDVVQDTFEKVWLKHSEIDGEKAKSYLFSAAYHTMIDMLRKKKRTTLIESENDTPYISKNEQLDVKSLINDALERLPEAQKAIILLRDYEGYSYEEIAEITNLNESQVKVYIYRGRMAMKNYLVSIENVI